MLKKIWSKLFPILKNYYVIVTVVFVVWMIFFDNDNLISQYNQRQELKNLQLQKKYFTDEIDRNRDITTSLVRDEQELERYAREKYLMKRPGEDIYLIIPEKKPSEKE